MQICCRPSRPRYASTTSSLRPRYVHQVLDKTIPRFLYVLTASKKTALRSYHVLAVPNTSVVGSYHVHTRFELRERRLLYGHYDRLLAELRIQAFFNFMRIPPEMLSARHFLTAISSCFATYLTLNTRLINIFTVRTYWKRSSRVV